MHYKTAAATLLTVKRKMNSEKYIALTFKWSAFIYRTGCSLHSKRLVFLQISIQNLQRNDELFFCRTTRWHRTSWSGLRDGGAKERGAGRAVERRDPLFAVSRKAQRENGSLTGRAATVGAIEQQTGRRGRRARDKRRQYLLKVELVRVMGVVKLRTVIVAEECLPVLI